jgi:hypothetical protein
VFIDCPGRKVHDIVAAVLRHDVRVGASYGGMIRAVTHLDVTAGDMEIAAAAFAEALGGR